MDMDRKGVDENTTATQGRERMSEDNEEEVCEHEWEVDRVTDWSMHGSRIVHVNVQIYCSECGEYGDTDCSWEFDDDEVL
tara:strand:+ start:3364 stop:3603 length:240 start_codon:yes stop_codon:yes gene_type:complete